MSTKKQRINHQIASSTVRLIDENGDNIGVIATKEAIDRAIAAKLDLVEVSANAEPPVCRILDFNKYQYEQKSKFKKTKNKTKKTEVKELYLSPGIGEGDLKFRINRGKEFLEEGNVVKYGVKFKGRERAYPELGEKKLKIVESELASVSKVEQPAKLAGSVMTMVLVPKAK